MRGFIARTGLKRQNFPVFSRKTGNIEPETGSPMTASTARTTAMTYDEIADLIHKLIPIRAAILARFGSVASQ